MCECEYLFVYDSARVFVKESFCEKEFAYVHVWLRQREIVCVCLCAYMGVLCVCL